MTPFFKSSLLLATLAAGLALQARTAPKKVLNRGGYLVQIMGCNDCHTPLKMGPKGPEPDMSRMLSGHPETVAVAPAPTPGPWLWSGNGTNTAFAGPWGVTFSANLTPDKETGLSALDSAAWIKLVRSGRHLGKGRAILPPMPIMSLQAASDEDLKAVHAYLRSIPAVKNRVPSALEPAKAN